ncbi:MAG: hypothetical protein WHT46_06905 [Candidatus Geothermincolales bacterium]
MRFRRYRGPDVTTVLRRVRRELGDEAVIVKTEEKVEGGVLGFFGTRVVEVLVALPEKGESHRRAEGLDIALPREVPEPVSPPGEESGSEMGGGLAREIARPTSGDGRSGGVDAEGERKSRDFLPLGVSLQEGGYPRRVLAFGPAGSGKTSTLGRLAWHFGPLGNVNLVSLEEEGRLSGASRWRAFWEVLGVRFLPVKGFEGLRSADLAQGGILLVDTPPLGSYRHDELAAICRELSLKPFLVVDAAWDLDEFRAVLEEFGDLPGLRVVVSKFDAVRVPARREMWRRELSGTPGYFSDSPSIDMPLRPLVALSGGEEARSGFERTPSRLGPRADRGEEESPGAGRTGKKEVPSDLLAELLDAAGRRGSVNGVQGSEGKARPWVPRRLVGR